MGLGPSRQFRISYGHLGKGKGEFTIAAGPVQEQGLVACKSGTNLSFLDTNLVRSFLRFFKDSRQGRCRLGFIKFWPQFGLLNQLI